MSHRFALSVYYEDTDMAGVVYHANYLKFIERARSDSLRDLGLDQEAMRREGRVFAVHRIEADFIAPARFGDSLVVETRRIALSPARLTLSQVIRRGNKALFRANVVIVMLDGRGRPQRLPAEIRQTAI